MEYDQEKVDAVIKAMAQKNDYTADQWTEEECVCLYQTLQSAKSGKNGLSDSTSYAFDIIFKCAYRQDNTGKRINIYLPDLSAKEAFDSTISPDEAMSLIGPQVAMYEYCPYSDGNFVSFHQFMMDIMRPRTIDFYKNGAYPMYVDQ